MPKRGSPFFGRAGPSAYGFETALLAWAGRGNGRTVHILNLAEALYRRVAWHPLRSFSDPDEVLFSHPDREPGWETSPSRH